MDIAGLTAEVHASLIRRGFLSNSPVARADAVVIEQALRWAGEVGEFCQRMAKEGLEDRHRLAAEWADAMIVGLAVGGLLGFGEQEITAKLRLDEQRGWRHGGTSAIERILEEREA
ncbi:MAG: hypothetical protein Kow0047_34140 [Anaerolineae bacterium]